MYYFRANPLQTAVAQHRLMEANLLPVPPVTPGAGLTGTELAGWKPPWTLRRFLRNLAEKLGWGKTEIEIPDRSKFFKEKFGTD